MNSDLLLVQEKDAIMILKLNRPEVMNSLNSGLVQALQDQISSLRYRSDIRVVVLTGAGEKAFSAGADLKERLSFTEIQVKEFLNRIRLLFSEIENLSQPVIAAVNGIALGGGTELALACDIRIASDNANMGLTETRLAIIPGGGGTQRLPRLIGRSMAKELIFTGRKVNSSEALRIGLVNSVFPQVDLLSEAKRLASDICESAPIAVAQAKYAINIGIETDLKTGLAIESNAYWLTIPTQDRLEGLAAFREKRKPVYKGN